MVMHKGSTCKINYTRVHIWRKLSHFISLHVESFEKHPHIYKPSTNEDKTLFFRHLYSIILDLYEKYRDRTLGDLRLLDIGGILVESRSSLSYGIHRNPLFAIMWRSPHFKLSTVKSLEIGFFAEYWTSISIAYIDINSIWWTSAKRPLDWVIWYTSIGQL